MPKEKWINQHIGETQLNNAGLKMTITGGTKSTDITITFEDGSTIEHREYKTFKNGEVAHPKRWIIQHLNETRLNNSGLKMTITGGSSNDLTVTFEDGSTVKHKRYFDFKNGKIEHPDGNWTKQHLNETHLNNAGLKMTITGGNSNDLTVTFEDGSTVKHKTYSNFKKGNIKHPNGWIIQHLNETHLNNAGLKMTIAGGKSKDLTIIFEDRRTIKHKTYDQFTRGIIEHPDGNWTVKHKNEENINNNGMKMKIIGGNAVNLAIAFEDGSIMKNKRYETFKRKMIHHKLYPSFSRYCQKSTEIGCITRKKIAYKTDTCHYYCTCNICQHDDIWNWKEIHEHNVLHGIPKKNLIFIEPD